MHECTATWVDKQRNVAVRRVHLIQYTPVRFHDGGSPVNQMGFSFVYLSSRISVQGQVEGENRALAMSLH